MAGSKNENVENVEVLDYAQQLEDAFYRYCDKYAIEPNRNEPDRADSFFSDYETLCLFRADVKNSHCNSKICVYDVESIQRIVRKYIQICYLFFIFPKVSTIANLLNFSHAVLYKWEKLNNTNDIVFYMREEDISSEEVENENIFFSNNSMHMHKLPKEVSLKRVDVIKMIRQSKQGTVTNRLSTNPQGATVLGNNDNETGLLWEPRNLAYKADLAQEAISTSDIAKKYGINGGNNSLLNG